MDRADRLRTPPGERMAGAVAAAVMVGLLGAGLICGLAGTQDLAVREASPAVTLDLSPPPPRKRPIEPAPTKASARPASPRNLRNLATEVAVPPPLVRLAPPPPIIVAPRAATGMAAQTGASDRPGPGQGAGGDGTGSGGGGEGDGDGHVPPRQIRGNLTYADLPAAVREAGIGASVGVRYRVRIDGRVDGCIITRSSGMAEVDAQTCRLIEQRFRFRPSTTADGQPVVSSIIETHSWFVDRDDDPPPRS